MHVTVKLGLIETISTHCAVDTEWASAGRAGLFPENILPGSGTALACSWVFFYHFGLNLTHHRSHLFMQSHIEACINASSEAPST